MSKQEYQKIMDMTFKGSFLSNNLAKLLSKEISVEDYKKLLLQKVSEISSKNPSSTEEQKYQMLMTAKDEKIETPNQSNTTQKLVENSEKSETKKTFLNNFTTIYLLLLFVTLGLSVLMTGLNLKLGKQL